MMQQWLITSLPGWSGILDNVGVKKNEPLTGVLGPLTHAQRVVMGLQVKTEGGLVPNVIPWIVSD
jgi:hypothetical protein